MKNALFNKTKMKPVPAMRVPVHVAAAAMQPMVERRMRAIGRVVMPVLMLAVSIGFGMIITTMTDSTIAGYVVAILAALFLVVPQLAPPIPEAGRRFAEPEAEPITDLYEQHDGFNTPAVGMFMPGNPAVDRYWYMRDDDD